MSSRRLWWWWWWLTIDVKISISPPSKMMVMMMVMADHRYEDQYLCYGLHGKHLLLLKSCHHLFTIYSPPFYHLFIIFLPSIIINLSSTTYSPYIHHLFTIYSSSIHHQFIISSNHHLSTTYSPYIHPSIQLLAHRWAGFSWSCIRADDWHQKGSMKW